MTNEELINKIRDEILHLKMKELQRTNGINTGADVYLSSYAVLSILSNALTEESEDERVIRTLYYLVGDHDWLNGATKGEVLTWLEKQKESLHISESCKENADSFTSDLEEAADNFANQDCARFTPRFNGFIAGAKWQKKQKPAEWSEKDEAMRDNILRLLSCFVGTSECDSNPSLSTSYPAYQREMDWLKSLRPSWKPSEEQIEALRKAINKLAKTDVADSIRLSIMYDNLKKL